MGIHLCVEDDNGNEVKEWDSLRQGNDRDFANVVWSWQLEWDERIDQSGLSSYEYDDMVGMRPKDICVFRECIKRQNWKYEQRYLHLADLLEKGYWFYVSR